MNGVDLTDLDLFANGFPHEIFDRHRREAPVYWHEPTEKERASVLKYLMYLKEKRDGSVKGRGCADGRPQRVYTSKNECSSPTASLAGLIMTCVIDAYERRDVATLDIPGAFLQTRMPDGEEKVYVMLEGRIAELLEKNGSQHIPRICSPQARTGIHILHDECCIIWNSESSSPVLEETCRKLEEARVCDQPL